MSSTTTPTDDVLPQVRTADLIQHVDQDLYGAYAVARRPSPRAARPRPSSSCPEVGRVHRAAQPALRRRVVVLRRASRPSSGGATCGDLRRRGPGRPASRTRASRRPVRGGVRPLQRLPRARHRRRRAARVLHARRPAPEVPPPRAPASSSSATDASIMWLVHGWIFMVYVVVAFLLSRRANWSRLHAADADRRPGAAADLLGRAPGRPQGARREPRARGHRRGLTR